MGLNIGVPPAREGVPVVNNVAQFGVVWLQWFQMISVIAFDQQNSGPTVDRPTADLYVGKTYFDTTLGYPIWHNGSTWVNATGTTV